MSMSSDNVVISLRDRLRIEQEIESMLKARSQREFSDWARRIAARGDQVISVILSKLDRADPPMLGGLGTVASLYPHREEILNKLRRAAADPSRSDQGRVSAMMILERFLGALPDPDLIETLDDPRSMVIQSVQDMIRAAEQEPAVFLQYVHSLTQQPEDTVLDVIEMLLEVGHERAVPVLSLIAQQERDLVAEAAILALGRLRHPEAVRGLQTLLHMLSPALRPLGDRSLLKLRLCGLDVRPLPPVKDTWRALVSPVDGHGNQVVWFIEDPDANRQSRFVGVVLNHREGLRQAYGSYSMPAHMLPERRQEGSVYVVTAPAAFHAADDERSHSQAPHQSEEAALHMLETDFEYGRRLVQEARKISFDLGRALPPEYCLFGPLLWQYGNREETGDGLPPAAAKTALDLLPELPSLLSHPAFNGWIASGERVLEHAMGVVKWTLFADQRDLRRWAVKLAEEYFDEGKTRQLRARLEKMREWLWRAGEVHLAELAGVAAVAVVEMPPSQNPFTVRMAELGLDLVVYQLQRQLSRKQ